MQRIDNKNIPERLSEIRCFCLGRNEAKRIPLFLEYHKNLGVDRFFYIDNNSDDESVDLLLEDESTHVWSTSQAYQDSRFGVDWQQHLMNLFGVKHWCLLLDIDEFFYFPFCDKGRTFEDFLGFLVDNNYAVVKSMMLDMYSDRSIDKTVLLPGKSLFETCPFFDRPKYLNLFFEYDFHRLQRIYFQGVRKRVFSTTANVRKYILIKYEQGMRLKPGHHHYLWPGKKLAKIRTFIFHFKFLEGFVEYSRESIERGCHWNSSSEYKNYLAKFKVNPDLMLYDANVSIKYRNTDTFVENKIVLPRGKDYGISGFYAFLLHIFLG